MTFCPRGETCRCLEAELEVWFACAPHATYKYIHSNTTILLPPDWCCDLRYEYQVRYVREASLTRACCAMLLLPYLTVPTVITERRGSTARVNAVDSKLCKQTHGKSLQAQLYSRSPPLPLL